MSVEIVHVYRGSNIESIHRGDLVAINNDGKILFKYGNPYKRTFWRSSAKPFQLIPFLLKDGLKKYNLTTKELALMTSSHGGEAKHVEVLSQILTKLGKTFGDLDCGTSRPMYAPYYHEMLKRGVSCSPANNPCSGKHSSMIGLAIENNWSLDNYIQLGHPVQQTMLETIAAYTELKPSEIDVAIDGCGVPVFGLPLYNMAMAYSKLNKNDSTMTIIRHAMTTEPFYVAGTKRLDTILMEETQGRILAKLGAESVYCLAIQSKDLALAMKIEDGSYRALDAFIPDLLLIKNLISQNEHHAITSRLNLKISNHRGEIVGHFVSIV